MQLESTNCQCGCVFQNASHYFLDFESKLYFDFINHFDPNPMRNTNPCVSTKSNSRHFPSEVIMVNHPKFQISLE